MKKDQYSKWVEETLKDAIKITDLHICSGQINYDEMLRDLLDMDSLKESKILRESNEYKKKCLPYERINQEFLLLYEQYKDSYGYLHKDINKRAYRREYSKGGIGFHRGYYSPSQLDLVIRGVNRGHLLKRGKNGKETYEYLFDTGGNLICVYYYGPHSSEIVGPVRTELFVYEENEVFSFLYEQHEWDVHPVLVNISRCTYNDKKLIHYQYAECPISQKQGSVFSNNCGSIDVEDYHYSGNWISDFDWYQYVPVAHLLSHYSYALCRDRNGNVLSFTSKEIK